MGFITATPKQLARILKRDMGLERGIAYAERYADRRFATHTEDYAEAARILKRERGNEHRQTI